MKKLSVLLLPILVSSCDSNNSETAQLIGTWSTEACEQATSLFGPYEGLWVRGKYEFEVSNVVTTSSRIYTDSTCTAGEIIIEPGNNGPSLSYIDFGEVTLQEGIQGHQFNLIPPSNVSNPIEGYYTITNGKLCFSSNISFNPLSIEFSETAPTTIDFWNCLVTN